jgi:glycosyltransferase involved in cell wall biosynthesis
MSVAIDIPCYNVASYIGRCTESALNQSLSADKIVVIDDGSTDDSYAIISKYPVHTIRHGRNLGLAAARNTALENVDTDIIVYIDADAYADQNMLQILLKEYERGDFAGVGGQGIEVNSETVYDQWRSLHAHQSLGESRDEHREFLAGLCMSYRCSTLSAVKGFDATFRTNGEDIDLGIRMNEAGFQLVYTPEARVFHQRQDNHASLQRMMYWWYYWAFIAKKKNGRNPWSLLTGTLRRMLWSDTLPDLFIRRSIALARLDLELSLVKIDALRSASRSKLYE